MSPVFIERSLLTWLLLVVAMASFDAWLTVGEVYSGSTGGDVRWGIPFTYYIVRSHEHWMDGAPRMPPLFEAEALLMNLATFAAIAVASALLWPSRSASSAPPMPSPLGASARPDEAAKPDERAVAELDRRSRRCLRRTIAGSVLGLGLIFGALGWLRGKALQSTYARLGRSAPWTAAAAWAVGRGIVCAALIGILGLVFMR